MSTGQTGHKPGGVPPEFSMFIGFFFPHLSPCEDRAHTKGVMQQHATLRRVLRKVLDSPIRANQSRIVSAFPNRTPLYRRDTHQGVQMGHKRGGVPPKFFMFIAWWEFRPRKKYFKLAPPPKKFPNSRRHPPGLPPPILDPLLGLSKKKPTPSLPVPRTPPSPPPKR